MWELGCLNMDLNFLEEWQSLRISITLNILTASSQLKLAAADVKGTKRKERRRLTYKRGKTAWLQWTDISMNLMI